MKIRKVGLGFGWVLILGLVASVKAIEPRTTQQESGTKTVSGEVRDQVRRIELLPPGPENPRNSEGDFIRLNDGRVLLVYTHFTGGAGDHARAYLAGRFSADGGQSWKTQDVVILPNNGQQNIMSVSLLRLKDGQIRKNSLTDCRPVMRISNDKAQPWSDPVEVIPPSEVGYYVLNTIGWFN